MLYINTNKSIFFLYKYTLIVNHTTTYNTGASTYPIYENKKKKRKQLATTTTNYNSHKFYNTKTATYTTYTILTIQYNLRCYSYYYTTIYLITNHWFCHLPKTY